MNPDLTAISDAILALLAPLEDTYEVEPWPESPGNYQLTHPEGAVLVVFQRWRFDPPTSTDGGTQQTGCEFQVSTLNRSLLRKKKNPGAYTMIREVFEALHKQQIERDYLQCREIRLISQQNGIFHYAQKWRLPNLQL